MKREANHAPIWCYSCKHEITGKRYENMQCHVCFKWNQVAGTHTSPLPIEG